MPIATHVARGIPPRLNTVKTQIFNVDNGAGVTIDETILRPAGAITITGARVVYDTEAAGTIAGANVRIGTSVGGADVVASTALTNTAAIGSTTALTLLVTSVAAGTPLVVRHTGIASVAAGQYHVELDFYYDD